MSINATLVGQMITFALLVWFTMKYIWPPLLDALDERKKKIAEGLAAAEQGHQEIELAEKTGFDPVERSQGSSSRYHQPGTKACQ